MANLCCVIHAAPYPQYRAEAALDFILAASAICEQISVVFIHWGVWQLAKQAFDCRSTTKNYQAGFASLPLYDIHQLYVDADALQRAQLTTKDLILPVTVCSATELQRILTTPHTRVIHF